MSVLESVIGWLAPPVCLACNLEGHTLCPACSMLEIIPFGERCWNCASLSPRAQTCIKCRVSGSPRFVWITTEYDGLAKGLIQKYKFGHQRAAASDLAGLMSTTFLAFNTTDDVRMENYVVVPVPTASSRMRQRGFDHTALLAERIAKQHGLAYSCALGRIGQSRQVGTKRSERIAQAQKNYFIRKPNAIAGRNVLLVDDVITTGATLNAASKVLRAAGARRVDALIFAKRL